MKIYFCATGHVAGIGRLPEGLYEYSSLHRQSYTVVMPQTKWKYVTLGYKLGTNDKGHRIWMSMDGQGISSSLADFGQDGWELVSTIFIEKSEEAGGAQEIQCFFKKPIS
jgi:hypothetical protein